MRTLLSMGLVALSLSPAGAEGWRLEGVQSQDCYVNITESVIERLDFHCNIKGVERDGNRTVYSTDCQTDAPSIETMTIEIVSTGADTATIRWGDYDTDSYRSCE